MEQQQQQPAPAPAATAIPQNNNTGFGSFFFKIKDPKQVDDVIKHESVHIDQMKRGDLDYDDGAVYWKGKKYSRAKMKEGAKNLPWEAEAYKKAK